MDKVPQSDVLIVLGDFNARVGKQAPENDLWPGTLGKHGLGKSNEAGEELLEFCATNQLTIMNTWFKKKEIHLGTWMQPATKQYHMIDYVVMCATQQIFCTDVRVMRGANCWSDHRMESAKVRVRDFHSCPKKGRPLVPFAVHDLRSPAQKELYRESLAQQLREQPHNPETSAEHSRPC